MDVRGTTPQRSGAKKQGVDQIGLWIIAKKITRNQFLCGTKAMKCS